MNWLARFEVDIYTARKEGIRDNYSWHKRLWEDCFPTSQNARRDFLTRIDQLEGAFQIWILANRNPLRPHWCSLDSFAIKEIAATFLSHRYYAFDLKANPVKTKVQRGPTGGPLLRPDGKRKSGKRVPLLRQDDLRAWLERKGKVRCRDQKTGSDVPGGFRIVDKKPLEVSPMVENHFRKKGHYAYHGGVQFRGILEVTDKESFVKTYRSGIGSAKSFGFGLLLLSPVNI